jgi:hypothetical protein
LFNEKNGTLPGRIIYYRDGVGEGQLGQVKAIELASIQVIERYDLIFSLEDTLLSDFAYLDRIR